MKRFRFELASVLRLAELEHRQALAELGRLVTALGSLREHADLLRRTILHEADRGEAAAARQLYGAYRIALVDSLRASELEVSRTEALVRDARQRLDLKRTRRDALTRLEEQRFEAWKIEGAKQEQAELEELASMRSQARRSSR